LSLCKSTVAITGLWETTKTRKGDTALMDEFTTLDMTDAQMKDVSTIEEWAKQGK
jgi:hypothetical protein